MNNNVEELTKSFVQTLSGQDYIDTGEKTKFAPVKRCMSTESYSSDLEKTPTKTLALQVLNTVLPSDEEIKASLSSIIKPIITETSSESETDENSEEENFTAIVLRKKKRIKHDAEMEYKKIYNVVTLPKRVLTRLRTVALLKPIYLIEQESNINEDILIENINRLKIIRKAKLKKRQNHDVNENIDSSANKNLAKANSDKRKKQSKRVRKFKIRIRNKKTNRFKSMLPKKSVRITRSKNRVGRIKIESQTDKKPKHTTATKQTLKQKLRRNKRISKTNKAPIKKSVKTTKAKQYQSKVHNLSTGSNCHQQKKEAAMAFEGIAKRTRSGIRRKGSSLNDFNDRTCSVCLKRLPLHFIKSSFRLEEGRLKLRYPLRMADKILLGDNLL